MNVGLTGLVFDVDTLLKFERARDLSCAHSNDAESTPDHVPSISRPEFHSIYHHFVIKVHSCLNPTDDITLFFRLSVPTETASKVSDKASPLHQQLTI